MSQRLCITCNAPYGKRHKKGCPAYIEPTYTREMIDVWNTRGVCPIDLNQTKAKAISEMIGNMPAIGFQSEREKNNWIGDYIHDLENS